MSLTLVAARFVHFAAVMILFGSSLFALHAGLRNPSLQLDRLKRWCAVAGLMSGVVWLGCVAARMSGQPAGAIDATTVLLVLGETRFGTIWLVQLALALLIVAAVGLPGRHAQQRDAEVAVLSAGMILVMASAGHAGIADGLFQMLFVANYALHLAAGAAWLGGLLPLALVLRRENRVAVIHCLERFSTLGLAAVGTLIGTGAINAWLLAGSPATSLASDWGCVLVLKLAVFVVLLGLATVNRFRLLPRLRAGPAADRTTLSTMIASVVLEQGLGLLIIAAASVLGTLAPPFTGG